MKALKNHMCQGQEDCEITSTLPECSSDDSNIISSASDNPFDSSVYYNVAKRHIQKRGARKESKTNMQVRIFTNLGKRLGLWQYNVSKAENIQVSFL